MHSAVLMPWLSALSAQSSRLIWLGTYASLTGGCTQTTWSAMDRFSQRRCTQLPQAPSQRPTSPAKALTKKAQRGTIIAAGIALVLACAANQQCRLCNRSHVQSYRYPSSTEERSSAPHTPMCAGARHESNDCTRIW
jgi:hypothetical protein